jgi:hypothetical protein
LEKFGVIDRFLTVDTVFFNSWIGTLCYPAVEKDSIHCQKTIYYAELLQDLLEQKKALATHAFCSARFAEIFFRVSLISLFFIFVRVDANTKSGWGKRRINVNA